MQACLDFVRGGVTKVDTDTNGDAAGSSRPDQVGGVSFVVRRRADFVAHNGIECAFVDGHGVCVGTSVLRGRESGVLQGEATLGGSAWTQATVLVTVRLLAVGGFVAFPIHLRAPVCCAHGGKARQQSQQRNSSLGHLACSHCQSDSCQQESDEPSFHSTTVATINNQQVLISVV